MAMKCKPCSSCQRRGLDQTSVSAWDWPCFASLECVYAFLHAKNDCCFKAQFSRSQEPLLLGDCFTTKNIF